MSVGGDRAAEVIDFVDAHDRFVRRGARGAAGAAGLYYRVTATILLSGDDHVLVYRRPDTAPVFPGHHDVLVGGSVSAGESYRDAARRELAEELGIRPELREVLRIRDESPIGPCHLTVHVASLSEPPRPDPREIASHELLPLQEVLTTPPRPFIPTGLAVLRRLFAA